MPVSDLRAVIDLPPVSRSVPTARRVVAGLLAAWAAEAYCDDAALLVSELVTNVVRHVPGDDPLTLEMHLSAPGLRVAVVDRSATRPAVRAQSADGGHGMWLVSRMADRWGSEKHADGKRVWFELGAAASRTSRGSLGA